MGWWTALKGTMGTRYADRIARAEADQLLAGQPVDQSRAGLAALLSRAAGPPRPQELAGEAEAVAAFRRLRSATPSIVDMSAVDTAPGGRRRLAGPPWRGATTRLAVVVLLLAAAGTATVSLTYRPSRMHPSPTLVPASSVPAASPSPSTSDARWATGRPPTPSKPPSPASLAVPAPPSDLALATQLCQVWTAAEHDKAVRDQAVRAAEAVDRPARRPQRHLGLLREPGQGAADPHHQPDEREGGESGEGGAGLDQVHADEVGRPSPPGGDVHRLYPTCNAVVSFGAH